ncbi:class I SAM-dependent methyltransferase [Candidatus Fermentibacterales bacterium]|nr:class I SAM-dependent methyltransferase [Candidatus Fermentibacterales bacterium]
MKQLLPGDDAMAADAGALGLDITPEQIISFRLMADLIAEAAPRSDLMGPGELDRLWPRHFLESMAYELMLGQERSIMDIGSGAGFPGMVLAIRGFRVRMLEPRRRRALFLELLLQRLGLDGSRVERARLEESKLEGDSVLVARAVRPLEWLLDALGRIAASGFTLVTRVGPGARIREEWGWLDLPEPPLDRPGRLVQVRQTGRVGSGTEGTARQAR